MNQTQMATQTTVEGEPEIVAPEEFLESDSATETLDEPEEHQTASQEPEEGEGDDSGSQPDENLREEPRLSKREEKRVQKLLPKLKEETARADKAESALREFLEQQKQGMQQPSSFEEQPQGGLPPWAQQNPFPQPGEEISPEQFQQTVLQTANNLVEVKIAEREKIRARFDNLKDDISYVKEKYNPDPVMEKKLVENYQKLAQGNPDYRLKDYVDATLAFYQEGQTRGQQAVTPKVLEQQAEGAIPPGPSSKSKGNDMPETEEEMEAWLKENGAWDE